MLFSVVIKLFFFFITRMGQKKNTSLYGYRLCAQSHEAWIIITVLSPFHFLQTQKKTFVIFCPSHASISFDFILIYHQHADHKLCKFTCKKKEFNLSSHKHLNSFQSFYATKYLAFLISHRCNMKNNYVCAWNDVKTCILLQLNWWVLMKMIRDWVRLHLKYLSNLLASLINAHHLMAIRKSVWESLHRYTEPYNCPFRNFISLSIIIAHVS